MEGYKEGSLLNNNFEEVLDIMSQRLESSSDVIKNRDKIFNLVFEGKVKDIDKTLDMFNIYWNMIPEELLKVESLKDLIKSISVFTSYISKMDKEFMDHGYSLLVMFYLKVCSIYINNVS